MQEFLEQNSEMVAFVAAAIISQLVNLAGKALEPTMPRLGEALQRVSNDIVGAGKALKK